MGGNGLPDIVANRSRGENGGTAHQVEGHGRQSPHMPPLCSPCFLLWEGPLLVERWKAQDRALVLQSEQKGSYRKARSLCRIYALCT